MPIDLTRDRIDEKLDRLTYTKGLRIKTDVAEFLAGTTYLFTADEIIPRIDTAGSAVMVESVLSEHSVFSHEKKNGKIYWYVAEEDLEEALEIAEEIH